MNLQNNEFVVSITSHAEMESPYLYAVTNFGRLFYMDGTKWVMAIG